MADPKTVPEQSMLTGTAITKEARGSFNFDLRRRLGDQAKILTPEDMAGLYDPKRALFTTVDGKPRVLTYKDLERFRAEIRKIRFANQDRKIVGGIKPRQVIDLSRDDDRERANKQIKTAYPVSQRGGVVHFVTNASEESTSSRHHVYIQFLNYEAAVSSPALSKKAAKQMTDGLIRYDCDCGRHTFWYRFICSIGGFAYGRIEDGYPKIRNPKLVGVACKHVLRVMQVIEKSATFKQYAAKMIETGRVQLKSRLQYAGKTDVEQLINDIAKERTKKGARVLTTEERRLLREAKRVPAKVPKVLKTVVTGAKQKAKEKLTQRAKRLAKSSNREVAVRNSMAETRANLESMGLPKSVIESMLKAGEAELRKALKDED